MTNAIEVLAKKIEMLTECQADDQRDIELAEARIAERTAIIEKRDKLIAELEGAIAKLKND